MTKRQMLLRVCENPGLAFSTLGSAEVKALDELIADAWVRARGNGWEATPRALA